MEIFNANKNTLHPLKENRMNERNDISRKLFALTSKVANFVCNIKPFQKIFGMILQKALFK